LGNPATDSNNKAKKVVKVTTAKKHGDGTQMMPYDDVGFEAYPELFDLLMPHYDGKVMTRQPGRMSLTLDGWAFKFVIACPTEKEQYIVELESLFDGLAQIEQMLASGKLRPKPMTDWKRKKELPTIDAEIK